MKILHVRLPPNLQAAIDRLRTRHHVNVSAWVRSLITADLNRDNPGRKLPPEAPPVPRPPAAPHPTPPIAGWSPAGLHDGGWGSRWRGDTSALPPDLPGRQIEVTTGKGERHVTTIVEVLRREADFVLVRDSGWD